MLFVTFLWMQKMLGNEQQKDKEINQNQFVY